MTRKSVYRLGQPGDFRIGENLPLKGLNFKVAHVEKGVLILALDGFTKAGIEALARLKVEFEQQQEASQREELKEVSQDMFPTRNEK